MSDPFINNVVLLLNPTGADGSTSLSDVSITTNKGGANVHGDAQVDTGVMDGGHPTLLFDGSDDAWDWNDHADFNPGSSKFMIEIRVAVNNVSGLQFMIANWAFGGTLCWVFYIDCDGGNLGFNYSTNGTDNNAVTGSFSPSASTFYDVAINYDQNKFRLFKDGVMIGSATPGAVTINGPTGNHLAIGANSAYTSFELNGAIARLRFTKGSDRGIGDGGYTPDPPGWFPTSGTDTLTPALFTNAQTFYTETVTYSNTLAPSLYTNTQVFYSATVSRGSVTVSPSLFNNAQTFYHHFINSQLLQTTEGANPYYNRQTFYEHTITQRASAMKTFRMHVVKGRWPPPNIM